MAKVFRSTRGVRPSGKPQAPFIPLYSTEVPFYVYINAAKEKAEDLINLGLFENTMFNSPLALPSLVSSVFSVSVPRPSNLFFKESTEGGTTTMKLELGNAF